MKLKYIIACICLPLCFVSCDQSKKKKETQPSIEEKAKNSSHKKRSARPQTGIPAAQAARRVGTGNDQRAEKSQKILDESMNR